MLTKEDLRQKCWLELKDYTINMLAIQPSSSGLLSLLTMAAYKRGAIETLLNNWFGDISHSDDFGRMRCTTSTVSWGRPNLETLDASTYFPYEVTGDCLFTPMIGRYAIYAPLLKEKTSGYSACVENPDAIHKLMYTQDPRVRTIYSDDIPLSTLWYEGDDLFYKKLQDTTDSFKHRCVQNNPALYRAIFHTHVSNHEKHLRKLCALYKELSYKPDCVHQVMKLFWKLSHLTLYKRGSAAITEMVCSAILTKVFNRPGKIAYLKTNTIPLDILAMTCTEDEWDSLSEDVYEVCFRDTTAARYYDLVHLTSLSPNLNRVDPYDDNISINDIALMDSAPVLIDSIFD